jgi:hypothetical protein
MTPTLLAKLALVGLVLVGIFVLVALGRITWAEGEQGITTLVGFFVVALGIQGAATTVSKGTLL